MKTTTTVKMFAMILVLCMMLGSCAQSAGTVLQAEAAVNALAAENVAPIGVENSLSEGAEAQVSPIPLGTQTPAANAEGAYHEGVVLVKYEGEMNDQVLAGLPVQSAAPLYVGSTWYTLTLDEGIETVEAVAELRALDIFEAVDLDYIMGTGADTSSVDVSCNPDYQNHKHHHTHKIPDGWDYIKDQDQNPGGGADVVVAVIDTGVDYNHEDLRNNIWVNSAEIPDNGIDDDGNGYIDDVRGWDCVGDDNDPMDDNGHGTHVAGIIAAENNTVGGVGIAFNSKIMVLKAGNSSGYFNNSDIAEAVQYAYMNGASVINMSFGGSSISLAVEEALANAYNQCVLVAAAGNEGKCNQVGCNMHLDAQVAYPAVLPYVIGVMSTNADGSVVSGFSNYDHWAHNSSEYEVYAVGESVHSCWPGNKYATLNGTSMAAPVVSGIAALLRSAFSDRDVYSTKYLQSQIVNTGTVHPTNLLWDQTDAAHSVANVYEALTKVPTPEVNMYDYYIFDNVEFSEKNNGNGVADAGETIRLAVELHNQGGVASDVEVTLDTFRNEDISLNDPYFTIVNSSIQLSDIGTYSVRDCGKVYDNSLVVGTEKYFEIVVADNCPNDYIVDFHVNFTYKNGMNAQDKEEYDGSGVAQLRISSGEELPLTISKDTVLTASKRYIVSHDVLVAKDVTLTIEAGTVIQFYSNDSGYYDTLYDSPEITNYGTINCNGTESNMVVITPSELFYGYVCSIVNWGEMNIAGTKLVNTAISTLDPDDGSINGTTITNSKIYFEESFICDKGQMYESFFGFRATSIENSVIYGYSPLWGLYADNVENSIIHNSISEETPRAGMPLDIQVMKNSVVYRSHNPIWEGEGSNFNSEIRIAKSYNNVFLQKNNSNVASHYAPILLTERSVFVGNKFYGMYVTHPEILLENWIDEYGNTRFNIEDTTDQNLSLVSPYISNIHMENMDGETVTVCGNEKVKFVVDFNRDMDMTLDTVLYFGTTLPYADYAISGEYVNARQWVGYYTVKALIENGNQRFHLVNARTSDQHSMECVDNAMMFSFNIDTTAAMSMNLQANPKDNGIELTFVQDDYDTLLGYNIYRSEDKDGNFVKLNPTVVLPTEETFLDENAEPGKTYWYTYTVVLSDFTESKPAGKVMATAKDTIAPAIYHTPVSQGYVGSNLVISCTASDNVGINSATLYYRTVGAAAWKTLTMSKQSDKYSATVLGRELTVAGLEYYIVAADANNTVTKGSAKAPYRVTVKDVSSTSQLGDVDGDGTVNAKDALMLMQCLNGDQILADDAFKRADLNGDGVLNTVEALRILQYLNGKVSTLKMG